MPMQMAGSRNSGSLMPPLRLVKKSAIQSETLPPKKMPTADPINPATKQSPDCHEAKLYVSENAVAKLEVIATRNLTQIVSK